MELIDGLKLKEWPLTQIQIMRPEEKRGSWRFRALLRLERIRYGWRLLSHTLVRQAHILIGSPHLPPPPSYSPTRAFSLPEARKFGLCEPEVAIPETETLLSLGRVPNSMRYRPDGEPLMGFTRESGSLSDPAELSKIQKLMSMAKQFQAPPESSTPTNDIMRRLDERFGGRLWSDPDQPMPTPVKSACGPAESAT